MRVKLLCCFDRECDYHWEREADRSSKLQVSRQDEMAQVRLSRQEEMAQVRLNLTSRLHDRLFEIDRGTKI